MEGSSEIPNQSAQPEANRNVISRIIDKLHLSLSKDRSKREYEEGKQAAIESLSKVHSKPIPQEVLAGTPEAVEQWRNKADEFAKTQETKRVELETAATSLPPLEKPQRPPRAKTTAEIIAEQEAKKNEIRFNAAKTTPPKQMTQGGSNEPNKAS